MKHIRTGLFISLILVAIAATACSTPAASTPASTQASAPEATVESTPESLPAAELTQTTGSGGETAWTYGCLGTAADAIKDMNCDEVTIAVENAYLPFNYVDLKTSNAGGWDYDAWYQICTRLHCTPTFVEVGWEGMIQAVSDGQYDAAADGITITDDRKEKVDFSIGYVNIEQRLLVRIDETRISKIEDIVADESLKLGTQTGTTNYEVATKYLPESRIQAFEQFPFAVQALLSGDIDAVIMDETAGQGYVGENADKLKLVGDSLSSDQLGFIFTKGSGMADLVNQALKAMIDDGTLAEINTKYFGAGFAVTYDDIAPIEYATQAP
jgi:polar amino acid transport system substrate-binding protein